MVGRLVSFVGDQVKGELQLGSKPAAHLRRVSREKQKLGVERVEFGLGRLEALSLRATERSPVAAVPDEDGVLSPAVVGVVDEGLLAVVGQREVDRRAVLRGQNVTSPETHGGDRYRLPKSPSGRIRRWFYDDSTMARSTN